MDFDVVYSSSSIKIYFRDETGVIGEVSEYAIL